MTFVEETLKESPKIQLEDLFDRAKKVSESGPIDLLHIRVFFGILPYEADYVHASVPDGGRRQKVV